MREGIALVRSALSALETAVSGLRGLALRAFLVVTAVQAAVVAVLVAMAQLRKRREGPWKGAFPWEEQPEVEVEGGGTWLQLHPFGVRLYEEMLEAIESAESHVFVGTFIWKGDETGRRFVDALAKKARQGVDVYVVFDGLANVFVSREFKRFPEEIHALHFRPLDRPSSFVNPRSILRYHRHVMSVDGKVSFLGGYNIGSLYAADWRDTQIRVRGEAVKEVENSFADFWNAHRTGGLPEVDLEEERSWDPNVLLRRNDPYLRIFPIRGMYLEAIDRANSRVYLTHAYFVPDRALRSHLKAAVKRGVDVQILLPRHSNHVTADWLARRHFEELLRAGVRIFGYDHIMIHSKTATVDGLWSTVGSANIDRYSLLGNYEANLEVYSAALAAQMERMFELDKTNAREITMQEWQRRPLPAKIVERVLASLSPLV